MKRTILIAIAIAALVFGVVAYAYAIDTGTITVNATVNQRISLTLADSQADLALFNPANTTASETLTLNVRSNVPYDISLNDLGGDNLSPLGFAMTDITGIGFAKAPTVAGMNHNITFSADITGIDWPDATTVPLTHSYTYSVIAN